MCYAVDHGYKDTEKSLTWPKNVQQWIHTHDALKNTAQNWQSFHGKKGKYPEMERELLDY